jgi:hypothetical protein
MSISFTTPYDRNNRHADFALSGRFALGLRRGRTEGRYRGLKAEKFADQFAFAVESFGFARHFIEQKAPDVLGPVVDKVFASIFLAPVTA